MTHTQYAAYKRPTSEHTTYRDWSEVLEKIFHSIGQEKKSWGSNTHIRQNGLQNKYHKKRPRRSLHSTQGKNPSRRQKQVNIYVTDIGAPKYIRQILEDFKKDIYSNTIIAGDFNIPLSKMDRSSKQNINKDFLPLNNAIDWIDLTDIYRAFPPKEAKYTLFSNTVEHFQR